MSNTVTKSALLKDSVFGSGLYKKHRRRRYRNRNSSLKKKKSKKFYSSKRSNNFKFKPNSERIMSNWYWENYKKALEWQDRHKVAHWKSCALALLEENRYLLQIINSMRPGKHPDVTVTENLGKGLNYNRTYANVGSSKYFGFPQHMDDDTNQNDNFNNDGIDNYDDGGDDDDEDDENNDVSAEDNEDSNDNFEFEMSEEMIKFFEQSYKHKMDLKKLREKEIMNTTEQEIKKIQTNKLKRSTEMNLLYGDGASMIIGMETAVQLSFDKYCDTKSPKYWPNIPFRL